jgi:ornithine--oxo-acid transaminase
MQLPYSIPSPPEVTCASLGRGIQSSHWRIFDKEVRLAMNSQELIDLEERYGAHNYRPLDVVLQRGEGVWVYDVEGKRYLDCLSSYSALNQGHCHPRIMETLVAQARNLTLTSRAFRNDQLGPFYQEICQLTGYEMVLPMNTGAEAVETAIKAARKWGYQVKGIPEGRAEIIACAGNFHGRTLTIISFSTEPQYKDGYAPYTPGFVTIPYGDADALRAAITPNTAAFLFEPIQGEGGVVVPPPGYLRAVRDICAQHNVLLLADEIQTGLGRTGRLFACDHEGVRPDMMILGKALSGGAYPVSVVLSSREVLGVFKPGDHGSTYGGNPLGCAVARTALKVLVEEGMIENAARMGDHFQERLVEINSPHIKEVRGKGLLIGVELHPRAGGARRFCEALQACGVLAKETHTHVIRFAPPLIITRDQVDWMIDCIQDVLAMP